MQHVCPLLPRTFSTLLIAIIVSLIHVYDSQFRALQPSLLASPSGGRVVWASSLEASPTFYESDDWQLLKTEHSYESSKYQIDLIATHLDLTARRALEEDPTSRPVRHFISEPGVCSTNVSIALTGPILEVLKVWAFYIVSFTSYSSIRFSHISRQRRVFLAPCIILSSHTKLQ